MKKLILYLMFVILLSGLASASMVVSYNETEQTLGVYQDSSAPQGTQFIMNGATINTFQIDLHKVGLPTGNMSFSLFLDNGGNQLGAAVQENFASINVALLSGSVTLKTLPMTPITGLTHGNNYWITINKISGNAWGGGTYVAHQQAVDSGDLWQFYTGAPTYRQTNQWNMRVFAVTGDVVTNSSWNVTSENVKVGENSSTWNFGGQANITSNLLALKVTTNVNTNMSCRLDNDQNYSTMVATNPVFKSGTTKTKNHAMTVPENLTGTHCLYCSFVQNDGTEKAASDSGCLSVDLDRQFTSFRHLDIDVDDFIFNSASLVEMINASANSTGVVKLFIRPNFMVRKASVDQSTDLTMKISLNGVSIFNEVVRSISGLNDLGAVSIEPIVVDSIAGLNSLVVEVSENGAGSVNISEFQLHLVSNLSVSGFDIRGGSLNSDSVPSGAASVQNSLSVNRAVALRTWIDFSGSFSLASESLTANCRIENSLDSPYLARFLSSGADVGSAGILYMDNAEKDSVYDVVCGTDTGSVNANFSLMNIDLFDIEENVIHAENGTDPLSTLGSARGLVAGSTTLVTITDFEIMNGTGLEAGLSVSAQSTSGAQVVDFALTSQGSNCSQLYKRSFDSSSDVGVVKFYEDCEGGVSVGNKVNFSLVVTVAAGETLDIIDESLFLFEKSDVANLDVENQAPITIIISPVDGADVSGFTDIDFVGSDPNGDSFKINLTLYNGSNTTVLFQDLVNSSVSINFSLFDFGDYTLTSTIFEDSSTELLFGTDSINVSVVPLNSINVSLISPANNTDLVKYDNDGVVDVTFTFSVTNATVCDLLINGSVNVSNVSVAVGNNNIIASLGNGSYVWSVDCNNADTPSAIVLDVGVNAVPTGLLQAGVCPTTMAGIFTLFMMVMIGFVLFVLGMMFAPVLGAFGGMVLIMSGFVVVGCSSLIGIIVSVAGVFMFLVALSNGFMK